MKWLKNLIEHLHPSRPKVVSGQWYRLQRWNGEWYTTCHTVGDTMWVEHEGDAEIVGSGEAGQLLQQYCDMFGSWLTLHPVARSDARHPLRHHIPAPTQHYTLHETPERGWFARATVDGVVYETMAWGSKWTAINDAGKGMMYSHISHAELKDPHAKKT